jgi:hypothetical protein
MGYSPVEIRRLRRSGALFGLAIASLATAGYAIAIAQGTPAQNQVWRAKPKAQPDASDTFFSTGQIPELRIEISNTELQKLREKNREYVKAKMTENGTTIYNNVGIKLKGAAGSFRGLDDKPALTLNVNKFAKGQSFHAMHKFHLNNSVQDASYLSELISSDLFLAAGVPASRISHARVWLNERDLGFYVVKEGFDGHFFKQHYADATGNFYDGGFVQEIDAPLQKDSGKGPDDHSDLQALVQACRTPQPEERWKLISERLDVDQFLTFMAMEILTCHWDGYCRNRNNYRVYVDPTTKKVQFIPHGMDQMFGDAGGGVYMRPGALVSQAVLQNPEWEAAYKKRLSELRPLLSPTKISNRIDEVANRVRPVLAKWSRDREREFVDRAKEFRDRVNGRATAVAAEIRNEPTPAVAFPADGKLPITDWYEKAETEGAKLQRQTLFGEKKVFTITAPPGATCIASYRSALSLAPGRYQFVCMAKAAGVLPIESGTNGSGAGIRVGNGPRTNQLIGTTQWTRLDFIFTVDQLKKVELIAELRAAKGSVQFDAASFVLIKLKVPGAPN